MQEKARVDSVVELILTFFVTICWGALWLKQQGIAEPTNRKGKSEKVGDVSTLLAACSAASLILIWLPKLAKL